MELLDRINVILHARSQIGVKFMMGGKFKNGEYTKRNECGGPCLDCSGLVTYAFKQTFEGLDFLFNTQGLADRCWPEGYDKSSVKLGDLIFYLNYRHCGIYAGNGRVIECTSRDERERLCGDYPYKEAGTATFRRPRVFIP